MTTKKNGKPPTPARPSTPPTAQQAYERVRGEIGDLDDADLSTINLDIPQAVSVALGAHPGIVEHREALITLPGFDARWVDLLDTYALAAWFAHLQALPGSASPSQIRALVDEATALRTSLLGDADALVRRGLFDALAIAQIRAGQGHVDLANDLVALAAMFNQKWAAIGGRTLATVAEIDHAAQLGPTLIAALGVRSVVGAPPPSEVAANRTRAYTLFVRTYDEVRRGLSYLRWHEGDLDLIAPSLFRGRGGRPGSSSEEETPRPAVEPGTEPVPVDPKAQEAPITPPAAPTPPETPLAGPVAPPAPANGQPTG